jgi:hypothetical protein
MRIKSGIGILLLTIVLLAISCGSTTAPPTAPVLNAPANGATEVSVTPRLEWHESSGATTYGLQVSTTPDFATLLVNQTGIASLYYDIPSELSYNTTYYWRANASNADGTSGWSSPWSFTTEAVPSEVIRLYYYSFNVTDGCPTCEPVPIPGSLKICRATSTDGIHFTNDSGVRFSYDAEGEFGPGAGITDPDVVRLNDSSWLMFVSVGTHLLKATSPTSDGTFTLDELFHWNQGGVPGCYNFNGTVRIFMCYQGGINVAIYDQETGTLQPSGVALNAPPDGGMLCDASVIKVDDQYLMFYKYCPPNGDFPQHEIYLATSSDGITWTQHSQNRFIGMGSVPGAVYYNGVIYVYFCGVPPPNAPPADFAVAISHDKGKTFTFSFSTVIIEGKEGKTGIGTADPAAIVVSP